MAIKFRGQTKWDPALIIYQILTVQFLSYASLCLIIFFATCLTSYGPSIILIFDHSTMRLGTGKAIIFAHLLNALVGALLLKIFVERSKSCLDFSITYCILHFIAVWYYSRSIPDTFLWYFVNIAVAFIMCVTSELLCRREELKSIPISAAV